MLGSIQDGGPADAGDVGSLVDGDQAWRGQIGHVLGDAVTLAGAGDVVQADEDGTAVVPGGDALVLDPAVDGLDAVAGECSGLGDA